VAKPKQYVPKAEENTVRFIAVCLLLFSGVAYAGEYPWMKQEDPNTLKVYVKSEIPSITQKELEQLVFAGIRRARIKPVRGVASVGGIDLSVIVEGDKVSETKVHIFRISCYFGGQASPYGFVRIRDYGRYGTDDKNGVLEQVKVCIDKALDDYLKENFDL
jgi:hypothetical protein